MNAGIVVVSLLVAQLTDDAGSSAAVQLGQPTLGVRAVIASAGTPPSMTTGADAIGMVHFFAGNFDPNEGVSPDGRVLPIAPLMPLFSVLGTAWGGNGTTNFVVPNMLEHVVVGSGEGDGLPMRAFTASFGQRTTLLGASMPSHAHGLADGGLTAPEGLGAPLDVHAPSVSLVALINVDGNYPQDSAFNPNTAAAILPMLGEIRWFAADVQPAGWLPCDGRLLQISQYSLLYSLLSNRFGGSASTFALPDLRGRVAVGTGQPSGFAPVLIGQKFGSPAVTLTTANLPAHVHTVPGESPTQSAGQGQPFNLQQPSLGVTWMVARTGQYPQRGSGGGAFFAHIPVTGELVAFAGDFVPVGFVRADGRVLLIQQEQTLFSVLEATFGGSGVTSFAVPDLRGRTPVAVRSGGSLFFGLPIGAQTSTLTPAQLTTHAHALSVVHDAGVVEEDAGVVADAGTEEDAGVVADAGTEEDAGVETDAGTVVDAGVIADAGTEVRDAGMQVTDGGDEMPINPTVPGGCGCTSGSSSTVLLGAIAMLFRMRRRSNPLR